MALKVWIYYNNYCFQSDIVSCHWSGDLVQCWYWLVSQIMAPRNTGGSGFRAGGCGLKSLLPEVFNPSPHVHRKLMMEWSVLWCAVRNTSTLHHLAVSRYFQLVTIVCKITEEIYWWILRVSWLSAQVWNAVTLKEIHNISGLSQSWVRALEYDKRKVGLSESEESRISLQYAIDHSWILLCFYELYPSVCLVYLFP